MEEDEKIQFTLKQEDFQKRAFLEMLHHATLKLKRSGIARQMPDNEIDLHKDEFTHLYTIKGEEIVSLSDINPDIQVLVCS